MALVVSELFPTSVLLFPVFTLITGTGPLVAVVNQSCCCPSRPVERVIMPPTAEQPLEVELLLCGHHLRLSQGTLAAAGAAI